jgi:hypothetical protein
MDLIRRMEALCSSIESLELHLADDKPASPETRTLVGDLARSLEAVFTQLADEIETAYAAQSPRDQREHANDAIAECLIIICLRMRTRLGKALKKAAASWRAEAAAGAAAKSTQPTGPGHG